ncbi:hypothetical protein BLOT_010540 [Blomia tropicalis]|nr:hypothetical protein BLOT_010540 [Blomia tropicalis]
MTEYKNHVSPDRDLKCNQNILGCITLSIFQFLWFHLSLLIRFMLYQYHNLMSLWINDYHEKLRNLQNIPINVGVGINQEQLSTAQIQQLICWCRMVPTIRTLTIFHPYSHCDSIKLKTDESSDDDFQISFLTFESGRSSMIKAAKHFTNLKTNIMPTDDAIGEYLKQDYPCPDPQLLLIFGDCPIYNGFPSGRFGCLKLFSCLQSNGPPLVNFIRL